MPRLLAALPQSVHSSDPVPPASARHLLQERIEQAEGVPESGQTQLGNHMCIRQKLWGTTCAV